MAKKKLTKKQWATLAKYGEKRPRLLSKTALSAEHPDGYEGPCFCAMCLSYGEPDDREST